jgi:hypothetical protein
MSVCAFRRGRPGRPDAVLATGALTMALLVVIVLLSSVGRRPSRVLSPSARVTPSPLPPSTSGNRADLFRGLGAWASIFDAVPAYQASGATPPVGPQDVAGMAAHGVQVLFLQTAGTDSRTVGPLVDHGLLTAFLTEAHRRGILVIGWYLPTFANVATDLVHLRAIADFRAGYQRFDGVAVDIETTSAVPDPIARNRQLVNLSVQLRNIVGPNFPLAAIVPPPTLLEVINPSFWPDLPWSEIAPLYDAWIPMVYWTFRTRQSGFRDPARYAEDSVTRLRADLGNASAPVHVVGGLGDTATKAEYRSFVRGAAAGQAIGVSIFSYRFLTLDNLALLQQEVPRGGFDQGWANSRR